MATTTGERDELRAEVGRLRAGAGAPVAVPELPATPEPPRPTAEVLALRWRRWLRRLAEGG